MCGGGTVIGDIANDFGSLAGKTESVWLPAVTAGIGAGAGAEGLAGAEGAAGAESAAAVAGGSMPAAVPEADPTFGGALQQTGPGTFAAPGPALPTGGGGGIDPNDPNNIQPTGAGGPSMLSAASPTLSLDSATAEALGITAPTFGGADAALGNMTTGMVPGGAPNFGGEVFDPGLAAGDYNAGSEMTGAGADYGTRGAAGEDGIFGKGADLLKKLGISPATAALLGISGAQALTAPKLPEAAKRLQQGAGPAADAAQGVIQSGGTSSPAFATQKASIDSSIDQQIKEQSQAILQQAQNSGQGADSQVTIQQINKLKTQLETQRQALYAQAAQQNVQAALQSLGISDQALAQVANAQFAGSNQAKSSAAETAKMALMLQALSKDKEKVVGADA